MRKYFRFAILITGLVSLSLILASCSTKKQLPQNALDKLEEQWQALPMGKNDDLSIIRSWLGKKPTEQLPPESSEMETWCVEIKMPEYLDTSEEFKSMIWIVTRQNKETDWSAAPLMILSSSWPYEACGVGP